MPNQSQTKPTVIHSTFQLERKLKASPKQVFAAFADEATKRRWFLVAARTRLNNTRSTSRLEAESALK